jgi:hypothetical protein
MRLRRIAPRARAAIRNAQKEARLTPNRWEIAYHKENCYRHSHSPGAATEWLFEVVGPLGEMKPAHRGSNPATIVINFTSSASQDPQ